MSKLPTKKSARFRKLLPVVEAKLEEGYSYEEVVEILNKEYDLDLTLGVFRNYLYKERKNQNNAIFETISPNKIVDNSNIQIESQTQEKISNDSEELDISKLKKNLAKLRESAENPSILKKG